MSQHFAIGLDNPKTSFNIAGVLRACGCYGASMLAVSGVRYKKNRVDTQKCYRWLPFLEVEDLKTVIPYSATPVAVEFAEDAESLIDFHHPKQAYYIFGAEDGTLGESVLSWCPKKVMIPSRYCMNLAATVNVVLYDRMAKTQRRFESRIQNSVLAR